MTNKEKVKEFESWIESGMPKVWHRSEVSSHWDLTTTPAWVDFVYVIDDEYANIRKAQHDGELIEVYDHVSDSWVLIPTKNVYEYDIDTLRIKAKPPEFMVGDWCLDPKTGKPAQVTDLFFNSGVNLWMFSTNNNYDVYAVGDFKPCKKPEEYEWQWLMRNNHGYWLTKKFYKDEDEIGESLPTAQIIERFEPSKRVREV